MKKLFFLFLALVATTTLWAHAFKVDGIYYNYLDGNNVEVTYRGNNYDSYDNKYAGEVIIPASVTYNGTTYNVTSIGWNAFLGCSSLTSVNIPNSVTSIGPYAFFDCSSLTSIDVVNDNPDYSSVDGVLFSKDITTLILYPAGKQDAEYIIPNSVTYIGGEAFYRRTFLTSITIGNSVKNIGYRAFYGCYNLTSVTIPNSVTSIGEEAFADCGYISSITIPNSIMSIGNEAFRSSNIGSIIISASDIATFCQRNVNYLLIQSQVNACPRKLLIKDVETKEVDIPNSVESIQPYTFFNCVDLNKVVLSNNIYRIGESAFAGCTNLNMVQLGTGIEKIEAYAFAGNTKLYDIYCLAAEPPVAQESSFANYNAFLHVPCESQRLYMLDVLFGEFKYIECIASDEVPTDDIVITPGSTDVTITWPTEDGADTYTIVIKKDGEVVCTLTFNSEGQLLNIAFAPGRESNRPAQYAEQAGSGYRFTVTGLEEGTHYTYNIDVKNTANQTINSHTGAFTTQSTTAVENTNSQSPMTDCQKILRDGQLIILRDGVEYNAMGQEIQ